MVKLIFAWHERQTWIGLSSRTDIMPGGVGNVLEHEEHVGWKTLGRRSVMVQPVMSMVPARMVLACKWFGMNEIVKGVVHFEQDSVLVLTVDD
jgi:hypothetical protein